MYRMLDVYADFATNEAATSRPQRLQERDGTIRWARRSPPPSKAMMQDKRALQSATSHYFGQNFAKAFDIQYLDKNNVLQYCETTSWGLSTRIIGAIIMTHGDDQGLILPPRLAPIQVVIVPIFKNDTEKSKVMEVADRVFAELKAAGIRVKVDDRDNVSLGIQVQRLGNARRALRLEIGPKDVEKRSVALARRDIPGREGKSFVPQTNLASTVSGLLVEIQDALLKRATEFRDANIHDPKRLRGAKIRRGRWLGVLVVVREQGMRGQGQGRHQGHHPQHPYRPA